MDVFMTIPQAEGRVAMAGFHEVAMGGRTLEVGDLP